MQEIGITDQEQAMIDEMSSLSNELVPLEEEAMNQVQEGELEKALDYVYGTEYSTAIAKINSLKDRRWMSGPEVRSRLSEEGRILSAWQ